MSLSIFKDENKNLMLLQTSWSQELNPFLTNPSLQCNILKNVIVKAGGPTTINHLLGRKLQGWRLVRLRTNTVIFDLQDTNPHPELTLILQTGSGNAATVDIEVF